MSTAVDLVSLAAQGEMKVTLARGVVSQGASGTDYTGWSGVSSVFVEAKVEVREQSRGFATLTLTVEGSSNGSVWSTLETFTFGHGGSQSATVSSPPDHLRVSWAVGGHSEWQIIEVTAAPSVIDFTTDGGSQSVLNDPTELDNLGLWLDATQLALADNDPVASWPDSSGNGYNAAQATSADRPTYKTGILNGHPVVRFFAEEDQSAIQYLALSAGGLDLVRNLDGVTLFVVYANLLSASNDFVFSASNGTNADRPRFSLEVAYGWFAQLKGLNTDGAVSYNTTRQMIVAPHASGSPPYPGTGAPVLLEGVIDFANASIGMGSATSYVRTDDEPELSLFADAAGPTPNTASLRIRIGSDVDDGIGGLTGDIAELVVYQRVLTRRERRLVLEYLSDKYAIA